MSAYVCSNCDFIDFGYPQGWQFTKSWAANGETTVTTAPRSTVAALAISRGAGSASQNAIGIGVIGGIDIGIPRHLLRSDVLCDNSGVVSKNLPTTTPATESHD